jgi:hypothetical protein
MKSEQTNPTSHWLVTRTTKHPTVSDMPIPPTMWRQLQFRNVMHVACMTNFKRNFNYGTPITTLQSQQFRRSLFSLFNTSDKSFKMAAWGATKHTHRAASFKEPYLSWVEHCVRTVKHHVTERFNQNPRLYTSNVHICTTSRVRTLVRQ